MNNSEIFSVRKARKEEFPAIGQLMADVYSRLEGFPTPDEQPGYYKMLLNVGEMTGLPGVELLVATGGDDMIRGAVVFIGDMKYYGSGGSATAETDAAGFRLLAVAPSSAGKGIGRMLTLECVRKAAVMKRRQVVIHTTKAMMIAWKMYENIGFRRSPDLDFIQGSLPVFGFRLSLEERPALTQT
jgi:ribosomal protein S18 acetylase RimI-like enzyme